MKVPNQNRRASLGTIGAAAVALPAMGASADAGLAGLVLVDRGAREQLFAVVKRDGVETKVVRVALEECAADAWVQSYNAIHASRPNEKAERAIVRSITVEVDGQLLTITPDVSTRKPR